MPCRARAAIPFMLQAAFLALVALRSTHAEITLDGTLGPAGALAGPDFVIPDAVGRRLGANLFHSFDTFDVLAGESATFTGPASIERVISRVTGGGASTIDGLLRSAVPNADFYFINPNGIVFGEHASLDVPGAFHASTAAFVRLADGSLFHATAPAESVLTAASPAAFGFLNADAAGISVTGGTLEVTGGNSLSLIGGPLAVNNAAVLAPSGRIELASVASAGEAQLAAAGGGIDGFAALGEINLMADSAVSTKGDPGGVIYIRGNRLTMQPAEGGTFGASIDGGTAGDADGAGLAVDIAVRADISVFASEIVASSSGAGAAGDLRLQAQAIHMSGILNPETGAVEVPGVVASRVFASGDGGDIRVTADRLHLERAAAISTQVFGDGNGGDIALEVDQLRIEGRDGQAFVSTGTFANGDAGSLVVIADQIGLEGGTGGFTGLTSQVASGGGGKAGALHVRARGVELLNGAQISSTVFSGPGRGGDITVDTEGLRISGSDAGGFPAGIFSNSEGGFATSGDSGDVVIRAERVSLTNRGEISVFAQSLGNSGALNLETKELTMGSGGTLSASSFGFGMAGPVSVEAETIELAGPSPPALLPFAVPFTGIISVSGLVGGGGSPITVSAVQLRLLDGAQINSDTVGGGSGGPIRVDAGELIIAGFDAANARSAGIVSDTRVFPGFPALATGRAGDIDVDAARVGISGRGRISALSESFGDGGSIAVRSEDVMLRDSALISTESTFSDGAAASGRIDIEADGIRVGGGSEISTATATAGPAGSIALDAQRFVLDGGTLSASTTGPGNGGSILLSAAQSVRIVNGGSVTADSLGGGTGLTGNIDIVSAQDILLGEGARVSTLAEVSDGGNIKLTAPNIIQLTGSEISTSVLSGEGAGGNIDLDPTFITLNKSRIVANAFGGAGGNITLTASEGILISNDSIVSASSVLSTEGTVEFDSPDTDVAAGIAVLPGSFLDVSGALRSGCEARRAGAGANSLEVAGRGSLPVHPDGYLPSLAIEGTASRRPRALRPGLGWIARGGALINLAAIGCLM